MNDAQGSLAILAAMLLAMPGAADAQALRPMVPEDGASVRLASDVQLSPTGRTIAFVIEEAPRALKPGVQRRAGVWLVNTDGSGAPRRVTISRDSTSDSFDPRWSPDGRQLALISDHEGSSQVYVVSAPAELNATARRITSASRGVDRYAWSPDGSMIAYTTQDPQSAESRAAAARSTAVVTGRGSYTRLWTVATGEANAKELLVSRDSLNVATFVWSPDAKAFAVLAQPTLLPEDQERMRLVIIDRQTGRVLRELARDLGLTNSLGWSPDGKWISFTPTPVDLPYAWWLAIISPDGGPARPLLKEDTLSVLRAAWMPGSRHMMAEIVQGTHMMLSSIDIERGTHRVVATVNASQGDYGFSAQGQSIAFIGQTTKSPNDIWITGADGRVKRLTNLNLHASQWRLGDVKEVSWRNSKDGLLVYGVLITPPGYVAGRPYPTIVQAHQADLPWYVGWHGRWWSWGQLLASNGYVVFLPNYRGVTGQGYRLHMTLGDWGAGLQDLLDGVDYLVREKIADPNSLGIGGWSNGGFMTEWTITHTNRFKAAVAQAGHSNLFSLAGATGGYRMFGDLYKNKAAYEAHSPITFIRNAKTPTLIIHGERDRAVPVTQGYEFHYGLRSVGVETEMVVYPNEGHGISSPANQVDINRRVLEWFNRYLR